MGRIDEMSCLLLLAAQENEWVKLMNSWINWAVSLLAEQTKVEWVDWWLLICCGLRAGGPATAPQQRRQAQSTNQLQLFLSLGWNEMESNKEMKGGSAANQTTIQIHEAGAEWSLICWGVMAGGPLAQPNFHSIQFKLNSISAVFAINQLFEEKTSPPPSIIN